MLPVVTGCCLVVCSGLLGGCKVNAKDVETWQGTVKGPGKILAVMLADKYDNELRAQAGLAFVKMDRGDVSGLQELQRGIQELQPETRSEIIAAMLPGLQELLTEPAEDDQHAVSPLQVRAKDAAFFLITHASAETRQALTEAVVGWFTADFNGRSLAGNFSAEQVVLALGSPAAAMLVDAMDAKQPSAALRKLAGLVGKLGDTNTRQQAAKRLTAIENEMESDKFLAWLQDRIREQMKAAGPVDEKRVLRAAKVNRENFIAEGALVAMKHLGSEPIIVEHLLGVASGTGSARLRMVALQALEGHVDARHLDRVLALALDNNNPVAVRDYAFDRVGDIRSDKAIAPMWPLVQDAENQRLRWRAGELVLAIGGAQVLGEFFNKLPQAKDIAYPPEELEGYATRMGQMNPLPRGLARSQLGSPDWWDRVIALRFFERKGRKEDVRLLTRLVGDTTAVKGKGWDKGHTVGKTAKSAIAALNKRLQQASSVAVAN